MVAVLAAVVWIALAMTSAWSRSTTTPAASCCATASVSNIKAVYQVTGAGQTAPAAPSIRADFGAKPRRSPSRFPAESPVNTGPTSFTEYWLSDAALVEAGSSTYRGERSVEPVTDAPDLFNNGVDHPIPFDACLQSNRDLDYVVVGVLRLFDQALDLRRRCSDTRESYGRVDLPPERRDSVTAPGFEIDTEPPTEP